MIAKCTAACVGAFFLTVGPSLAASPSFVAVATDPAPAFDFVQQAGSLAYDGQTLTLSGIAPSTIYFSDRPYRMVGQLDNATFAGLWDGDNTFAEDRPNAAITLLDKPDAGPVIVELTSAQLNGSDIDYGVNVVSGQLPASATNIAMFVDSANRVRRVGTSGSVHQSAHQVSNQRAAPGPYCYHDPQSHECHPYPTAHPGATYTAGVVTGAAVASASQQQPVYYVYPIPEGALPSGCYINSTHTEMICTVPLQQ
jgi:hypothetical protein